MTDLSAKFSNLETELGGKLDTLNTNLGGKLDTVIEKLEAIRVAVTSASGVIEAAPIVAAIEALRGSGPENTIRSVNQSVWNIAGPAPGKSLTDLYSLWNPGNGIIPYNLLDNLYLQLVALNNSFGEPTGDATTTLLGILLSVRHALTYDTSNLETLYSLVRNINQSVNLPASVDDTVLGLLYKLLLQARATNAILDPIAVEPPDSCASPYISTGTVYYQNTGDILPGISLLYPGTFATFSGEAPTGITILNDLSGNPIVLQASDWTNYRVYVASTANTFGVNVTSAQRLATNTWLTLSANLLAAGKLTFYVDGSDSLKVYVCGTGTPPAILYWGLGDIEAVEVGSYGYRYMWNATKYPALEYVQSPPNPRVLYGTWDGWQWEMTGTSLYCQYGSSGTGEYISTEATGVFPANTHYILCQSTVSGITITLTPPS